MELRASNAAGLASGRSWGWLGINQPGLGAEAVEGEAVKAGRMADGRRGVGLGGGRGGVSQEGCGSERIFFFSPLNGRDLSTLNTTRKGSVKIHRDKGRDRGFSPSLL